MRAQDNRPKHGRTADTPLWLQEFGPEWDVPDTIASLEGIEDMSWHNDVAPSFGVELGLPDERDPVIVRIWSDHPEADRREYMEANRFALTIEAHDGEAASSLEATGFGDVGNTAIVWSGEDERAAVAEFLTVLGRVRQALR